VIRLRKGNPPAILVEKASEWAAEYQSALAAGGEIPKTIRFRYRHKDIKAAIREESHNKCIYCESPVGFGQTDHILPVSKCPSLVVDWDNLALVCTECNTHKSDYFDSTLPLINPYVEDPADFLIFLGPLVMALAGNQRGQATERQIKLNRAELLERRTRRLRMLEPLLHQWALQPPGTLKDLLKEAILDEASANKEYAATVRAYLNTARVA
jgi:hypothetical protein